MRRIAWSLLLLVPLAAAAAKKEEPAKKTEAPKLPLSAETFEGLKFRALGPAVTSGRVADVAVHPRKPSTYYVAVASGGVWKTVNSGTTWTPVFDDQGSHSIGCVTIDPNVPDTVWVGTGENNSQRSVGYGDGVYRSLDGGKTWQNMGLKSSEHIGKILVDPRNSNVVYVASQGPLWNAGGDRGLYKSTDGGKTWKAVLTISENTGVSDVWFDPRNPDRILATSYQRRRHVWGMVHGGPEGAVHKSTDAGATWRKVTNGLPKGDLGRIGLAVSPAEPDTVYALVEASDKKARGTYRSLDFGESWEKAGDYSPQGPQYYQELIPDPKNPGRVYSMDTWMQVTEDGGKTWQKVGEKFKHVDNHSLWIDPENTDYLLSGCDGGLYESWDRGATWHFKANLPVTQFYRVTVDNAEPFYNIYGGTQDNQTLGGPSRTRTAHGITNADWYVTVGGDGFFSQVDPTNPDIIYSESQNGGLVRYDRKTGETIDIRPQPGKGEDPLRFNWDSPLLLSPHSPTRLYFAGQKLFRSDDRGNTWKAISGDLTQQIDRNKLKMMGRVWSVDAVAKNTSTSFYGNIVSLSESPRKENLIYVGTDDGLVQVTEDAGGTWRKVSAFPGVPANSYVSDLFASEHDENTVYASFVNYKMGDFKPYLLRSADRGKTWTPISAGLPERGSVHTVAEDPQTKGLLFAGTEFGVFFSPSDGKQWIQLKGDLPVIAVRDLVIQKREGDLVLGTFGRGFYVLDDLTPVRMASESLLTREATLFPVKKTWMYIPSLPLGLKDKSFFGDSFYNAPNPPFGAVFTYHLKDEIKTRKKARQDEEKKIAEKGGDVSYPSWESLTAESREDEPAVLLTVTDSEGRVVRRLTGPVKAGFHRVAWDLRYPAPNPSDLSPKTDENPFEDPVQGPLAMPGTYKVSLSKKVDGAITPLGDAVAFSAEILGTASLPAPDRAKLLAFQQKTARLQRAVLGTIESVKEAQKRLDHMEKAILDTPAARPEMLARTRELRVKVKDVQKALTGDPVKGKYQEPADPGIADRVGSIVSGHWSTTSAPTSTHMAAYDLAATDFAPLLAEVKKLDADLGALETAAEELGAPWTPGRVPNWKPE